MPLQNLPKFNASEEGHVVGAANFTLSKGLLSSSTGCLFITPKRLIFAPYLVKGKTIVGFKDSTIEIPLDHVQSAVVGGGMLSCPVRVFIEPEYTSHYTSLSKKTYFLFTVYGEDYKNNARKAVSLIMRNKEAYRREVDEKKSTERNEQTIGTAEHIPQAQVICTGCGEANPSLL